MRTRSIGLTFVTLLAVVVSACGGTSGGSPAAKALKIGLVTDVGTLNDKSFNEASWNGTQDGATKIGAPAPPEHRDQEAGRLRPEHPDVRRPGLRRHRDRRASRLATRPSRPPRRTRRSSSSGSTSSSASPKDTYDKTCAGDALLPNYQGLVFAEAQAGYLAGVVAGTPHEDEASSALSAASTRSRPS